MANELVQFGPNPILARDYNFKLQQLTETERNYKWNNYPSYYSATGFKMKLTRRPKMYILMYYLPSTLFVIISWISFFIPPTAYPARFGLLMTTILDPALASVSVEAKSLAAVILRRNISTEAIDAGDLANQENNQNLWKRLSDDARNAVKA